MKLYSWNVNGLRAVLKKNFEEFVLEHDPDVLCLQETKARPEQVELPLSLGGYKTYWNSAEKAGYSGTAIFSKTEPLEVTYGMGLPEHDTEGRVITATFKDFHLVTVYTPNSQSELRRLNYRLEWDAAFRDFLKGLEKSKPVVFCGDLNVSHHEVDLARPGSNRHNPGFSEPERKSFTKHLEAGFIDTYRAANPDKEGAYSWWSYRAGARGKNVGWRLDYFCVSEAFTEQVSAPEIHADVLGSDHCPVSLIVGA